MNFIFWTCTALLVYIYQGYLYLLYLLPKPRPTVSDHDHLPSLTVLLTVHNEAEVILERITNLLEQDYPSDKLQVLVASDDSNDGTNELVLQFGDQRVRLFQAQGHLGKTATQNLAMVEAQGELLVFTDAGTRYEPGCLRALAASFADPSVGGATGNIQFTLHPGSGIAADQGHYWAYEQKLRRREGELGLLAIATGACLAVRRALLQPMSATLAEDGVVPLEVVRQGFRFVFVPEALAWDKMPHRGTAELRTRIRMTLRGWQGTWCYPKLLSPFHHPGYALALWSHKILRWCSPIFLLGATLSVALLAFTSPLYTGLACGFGLFYLCALIGYYAERRGWSLPLIHSAYSFLLAMLGFGIGVAQAILGQKITRYRSESVQ